MKTAPILLAALSVLAGCAQNPQNAEEFRQYIPRATFGAKQTYEASRLSIQTRLTEDLQMSVTSVRLAHLYRDTVLPQARLALESSMASYQTGAVDFLSVLTNFGSVLEYEMTYFDELTAFHVAVSRLEEMTGTVLVH